MFQRKQHKGITTGQMLHAPEDAVYIWLNHDLTYPRYLANKLGRHDLHIVGPSYLEYGWRGSKRPVVVDHETFSRLTIQQRVNLRMFWDYLEIHKVSHKPKSNHRRIIMNFFRLLHVITAVFVMLKLCGVLTVSWFIILLPSYGPALAVLAGMLIVGVLYFLLTLLSALGNKKAK